MIYKKHIASIDDLVSETAEYATTVGIKVINCGNVIIIEDETDKVVFVATGVVKDGKLYLTDAAYVTTIGNYSGFFTCNNTDDTSTANTYGFEVDRIIKTNRGFGIMSTRAGAPMVFFGKTNRNEVGMIGLTAKSNFPTSVKICCPEMVEAPANYNLTAWGSDDGTATALINVPVPESVYAEFFTDLYLIIGRQHKGVGKIDVNGKAYYSNGYVALAEVAEENE